jgi:hypothetical protein
MNLYKIDYKTLKEEPVKTTPENVKEANEALFRAKMTLPAAAKHCGMTHKEMKMTFLEYLKYNQPDYEVS